MLVRRFAVTFLAILAVAFAQEALAQYGSSTNVSHTCGSISANIVGSEGQPVMGATMELKGMENGLMQNFDTGSQPTIEVSCVEPGWYRVTARAANVQSTEELNVISGEAQTVTLRLPSTESRSRTATVSAMQLRVPSKARKQIEKAEQRMLKQDFDGALKYIDESLKIYPDNSEAYRLRGLVSLTEGHADKAVDDLDHAVKLDSSNAMAHIILGAAFNALSKFKQAVVSITAALPIAPHAWQAQYELGKAYAGMGELKQAMAALDRAAAINPKFPAIRYVRGAVLLQARQYAAAAHELKQYLQDDPNGPDTANARQLLVSAETGAK